MIKRTIGSLFVGLLGSFILLETAYDGEYVLKNIIDAGFLVGFILASFGLITLSNATQVFHGITFAFKQMFGRKQQTHMAFYDYKRSKERDREKTTGVPMLVIGLLFVIVTAIISYTQF